MPTTKATREHEYTIVAYFVIFVIFWLMRFVHLV